MSEPGGDVPNALEAYSMVLLACDARYLLLQRAASKRFAPGRWTGLGGRVEADEFDDLRGAALREVAEETGLAAGQIADFALRRVLLQARPGAPLTVLLYFTGQLAEPLLPQSGEGTLAWLPADDISQIDVIENTARVIPALIADLARDPAGAERVRLGVASFAADGALVGVVWSDD